MKIFKLVLHFTGNEDLDKSTKLEPVESDISELEKDDVLVAGDAEKSNILFESSPP